MAAGFAQFLLGLGVSVRVGVGHQIQLQQLPAQQHVIQRQQLPDDHTVLDGGDAVGSVDVLGLGVCLEQLLRRRHGDFLQVGNESVFFQISGEFAVLGFNPSALRGLGLGGNVQGFQGQTIQKAHMSGLVVDDQRIFGGEAVQLFQRREGRGFVIVPGGDPLAGGRLILFQELPNPAVHFLHCVCPVQRNLQLGAGHLGEMAVGVDKSGHQGSPVKIHLFAAACQGPHVRFRTQRQDFVILRNQGLGILIFLHGQDAAAIKQCFHNLHLTSLVCSFRKPAVSSILPIFSRI